MEQQQWEEDCGTRDQPTTTVPGREAGPAETCPCQAPSHAAGMFHCYTQR